MRKKQFASKMSREMSDYSFKLESEILYVFNKANNATMFAIVDIQNLPKAISVVKCLIQSEIKDFNHYYSYKELISTFSNAKKSVYRSIRKRYIRKSKLSIKFIIEIKNFLIKCSSIVMRKISKSLNYCNAKINLRLTEKVCQIRA